MVYRRCAGQETFHCHRPMPTCFLAPLQRVQHEAAMQAGCFIGGQRRAEACLDLARDRGLGENNQRAFGALKARREAMGWRCFTLVSPLFAHLIPMAPSPLPIAHYLT